eukprot:6338419-Pyramimonas_sp.AAC.1
MLFNSQCSSNSSIAICRLRSAFDRGAIHRRLSPQSLTAHSEEGGEEEEEEEEEKEEEKEEEEEKGEEEEEEE